MTFLFFGRAKESQRGIRNFLKVLFVFITLIALYIGIGGTIERFASDKLIRTRRPVYWGNTNDIIRDFPLFGSGLGTFASLYPAYEEIPVQARVSHAHNDYLEYISELGLVGAALLIGGILFMLVNSFLIWQARRHPEVKGLALGGIVAVVAILIHSITDFNLHIPANMLLFTVVLSMTVVTAFYKRRRR